MCSRLRYSSFHSYFGFIFNESSLFQSVRNDFFLLQESTQIQSKKKRKDSALKFRDGLIRGARVRFVIRINRCTGNYAVLTTRLTYEPSRFRKHVYGGVTAPLSRPPFSQIALVTSRRN